MKYIVAMYLAVFLLGCSGSPGSPLIRTGSEDGGGALISDCKNLSNEDKTDDFITGYYLTTWGSATSEGTVAGVESGLNDPDISLSEEQKKQIIDSLQPSSATFCKAFNANPDRLYNIITDILPQLGYNIDLSSKTLGYIRTDYVYRTHDTNSNARWKDRYIIRMQEGINGRTVVKVYRDVFISRRDKGEWSSYIGANSVGHNEAVILNNIKYTLSGSSNVDDCISFDGNKLCP